jgi:integrase/recombinase XerC
MGVTEIFGFAGQAVRGIRSTDPPELPIARVSGHRFPEARDHPDRPNVTTELVHLPAAPGPDPRLPAALGRGATLDLVEMMLAGLKDQTREGYRKDLSALAAFLGLAGPADAVRRLLALGRGEANALAAAFNSDMLTREPPLSPATVRRRYAAFSRVFKAGRRFGLTEVTPEAEMPRTEALRDTTGPGKRGWDRMLAVAEAEAAAARPEAARNLAVVLLLHDRGLRRGELAGLDWPGDFDPQRPGVQILGKGKREKVWFTVSDRAADAVKAWATVRGDWPGPLFTRCDPAAKTPERLTGHGLNDLVKALAKRAGLPRTVRAHGLRHQAVTEALDQGWGVRDTMQFSRHVDPRTVMSYDDRRKDVGGEIAKALGGDRRPPRRKR